MESHSLCYLENPAISAEEIAALRTAVGWTGMLEQYRKTVGKSYFWAVCFCQTNGPVGYVDVLSDGVLDGFVRDLMVHPQYRKRGIGSTLLNMAIRRLREDGVFAVNVLFRTDLTSFYEKAGFTVLTGGMIVRRQ